ncbi:hypothetical protein FAZ15_18550 [Sphingobacterium olei]|uniref:SdiA-regulated family protein n=1 Tax=Sphingobacterium olei TaxID=2571155 RepID=A0A4U0NGP5_9SPHI|nr:SdiA-regulated domain-containing protein [Sphingobacterium olei]TJZ53346.1 hypothetical protein FAZ15_18550 [Sphingobacterium olei]
MKKFSTIVCLFGSLICFYTCQPQSSANVKDADQKSSEFPYVLNPEVFYRMPAVLKEISGITFQPDKSDIIYAIQDEQGTLFRYHLSKKEIVSTFDFAKPGDYEDVATDGKFFYVLKSNGDLYTFPFDYENKDIRVKEFKGLLPKGEYESLAINPLDKTLYVLCKECKADKKTNQLSGHVLNMDEQGNLEIYRQFTIDLKAISNLDSKIGRSIKPSAMTKKNSTNEWYIISSIDRILLVMDDEFKPKEVIRFSRKDFEQPEGIAFDSNDNLFISSEAGNLDGGKIYQFNPRSQ